MNVLLGAVLAILCASWTPPQARGPWASGLRGKAVALYAALETPTLRLRVDAAKTPDSLQGPRGAVSWSLARDGGPRPGGTEVLRLVWTDSVGTLVRIDRVSVRLSREELVPVASSRMYSGSDVDTSQLRWEWRRTDGDVQLPASRSGLQGRRLGRGVGPGQVLLAGALEPPTVFRRQDRVRIALDREGASIRSEGIALEDGRVGRYARARGPFGNEVRGRVAEDSTLVVE